MLVQAAMSLTRTTGIPRDACINTWHFSTASSDMEVHGPEIVARLLEFYDEDVPSPPAQFARVSEMLSTELTGDWTLTVRDANPSPPNPVLYQDSGVFAGAGDIGLPAEVAIANSYKSLLVDPLTPGRYRGRIFIGPLQTGCATSDANGIRRVRPDAQEVLAQASLRLAAANDPLEVEWGVYSRMGGTFSPTVAGWVDDAFDTVRSRGASALSRRVWPA